MYKRYYDSYGNMCEKKSCGEIVIPESPDCSCRDDKKDKCEIEPVCPAPPSCETSCKEEKGFPGLPFDTDDLILIGILLFLLFDKNKEDDDGDNTFLYILIGIVVLSGFLDDKN